MAMIADENFESKSVTEEPPFKKTTFNTDYKIKTSLQEPPIDLELKPLPDNLEYVFLEEPSFLPVIISSQLSEKDKNKLVSVLKKHKRAFTWKTTYILGICPSFFKHKIQLLEDKKPVVQKQRRLNPNMQEVVKKEIVKLLDTGIIYPIADSPWVIPIHCVLKKGGITIVTNERNELVPTRTVTGWRVCIDYQKLNEATAKDYFPLPFMDQMLERLAGNKYFCFLDGFFRYFQIPIDPMEQEKTTFTCPFGTYAYRRMPFGLCNAPGTFQRCMLAIFHDMIKESVKVFMDDFFVFGSSFEHCLNNLDKMFQCYEDAHLVLNWEKYHFMVKEGILLGHKVSKAGLEVDKAKIDVISKLPPPTNIKAYKTPTDTTLFKLIYGKNCHLPFEIKHRAYWALKNCNPDLIAADPKCWHDRKVKMRKEFKHGNKVLLFNSKYKFKQPKLRSCWLGPYGYVELYGKDGNTFIVNGHRLKLYHEEEEHNDQGKPSLPSLRKIDLKEARVLLTGTFLKF
ncbi:reverse transcriptase domain-containing protein [Tanacetum coccineum]